MKIGKLLIISLVLLHHTLYAQKSNIDFGEESSKVMAHFTQEGHPQKIKAGQFLLDNMFIN